MGIIYKIIELKTNHCVYVGSTSNIKTRMKMHKSNSLNEKHTSPVYKYIRQNGGWSMFTYKIIEETQKSSIELKKLENHYITLENPLTNKRHPVSKRKVLPCIYKVIKKDDDKILYIGSTSNINQRIINHKSDCYNVKSSGHSKKLYKYIRKNGEWEDYTFTVIENNIEGDLEEREKYYINKEKPLLNITTPNVTSEEIIMKAKETTKKYREKNKDIRNKNNRKYREASEYINCDCGSLIKKHNTASHLKTDKHNRYLNNQI